MLEHQRVSRKMLRNLIGFCMIVLLSLTYVISEGHDSSTYAKNTPDGVCHDVHCEKVAEFMKKGIEESVKPCDNFYQYACGGWMKNHKIPEKKEEFSAINELSDNNDKLLKQFLDGTYKGKLCDGKHPTNSKTIMKVRNFYKSCLDTDKIEKRGSAPLREFIDQLGGWDIDDDFDEDTWDFTKVLQTLHAEYPAEIFFTIDVDVDPRDKKKNIITVRKKPPPPPCYRIVVTISTKLK